MVFSQFVLHKTETYPFKKLLISYILNPVKICSIAPYAMHLLPCLPTVVFNKRVSFHLLWMLLIGYPVISHAQSNSNSVYSILKEEVQEIAVPTQQAVTWLQSTLEVFHDHEGHASLEQVLAHKAWSSPNEYTGKLAVEGVYWMKTTLLADSGFQDTLLFHLQFDNRLPKSWAKIDAYLVHQDGRIEQQVSGVSRDRDEKDIPVNFSFVGFGLDAGEQAQLLVRVEGGRPVSRPPLLLGMLVERIPSLAGLKHPEQYEFDGTYYVKHEQTPFRYNFDIDIEVLTAPKADLSLAEVLTQGEGLDWKENYVFVLPQRGEVYWIKSQLIGSSTFNGEHIFQVAYWGSEAYAFDHVDVYTAKRGEEYSLQRTGNAVPTQERPYDFWATLFKVELQDQDTVDIYIRLEGVNRSNPMPYLRILHVDPSSLFPSQVNAARRIMFVIGAIIMEWVFFLGLFLVEKERIHFYFCMLILGSLMVNISSFNSAAIYIPFVGLSRFNFELNTLGAFLSLVGLVKFTETYFNYPRDSFFSHKLIPLALLFLAGLILCMLLIGVPGPLFIQHIWMATVLLMAALTIGLALAARKQARVLKVVFFIALLPPIITGFTPTLVNVSLRLGLTMDWNQYLGLGNFLWESHAYAFLFMFAVLSISIGYRKNILKREKDEALENNLKAQQIIIEKLEETARLEKMDEVKTRFFTNITHEFRTPLTVILGLAEELRKEKGKSDREDGLRIIKRNGQKLLHLINQLLDLSKIDTAQFKLHYQNKEVVSFTQYVGESFESLAEQKGVRLSIYSEIDELTMAIDPVRLQQIIANLLSNAIKFTAARGKVILHLSQQESTLLLKVKDTGQGIPEAALPSIFDRFYQVDGRASRQGEGTGIGLALVKELVQAMEGGIQVKSQLGRGTEFLVSLPINLLEESVANTESEYFTELPPLGPLDPKLLESDQKSTSPNLLQEDQPASWPQLLIVEDNPDVVFYLQSILSDHYQLQIATDGQQGIDLAIEQVPDLILSDVMMPQKTGFELVDTLKSDERTSHIPMILVTAKATQGDKIEGLRHGADAYLMKPFDKEELMIRLANLLQSRRVIQRKYSQTLIKAPTATSTSAEDRFMEKLNDLLGQHFEDSELNVKEIAGMLDLSHQQFYRKLKALTDQAPVRYLRRFRLQKAKVLLMTKENLNVSEVAYAVGFDNPNYFSRVFVEEFGIPPNQLRDH